MSKRSDFKYEIQSCEGETLQFNWRHTWNERCPGHDIVEVESEKWKYFSGSGGNVNEYSD